jgi:hypothetical protein
MRQKPAPVYVGGGVRYLLVDIVAHEATPRCRGPKL